MSFDTDIERMLDELAGPAEATDASWQQIRARVVVPSPTHTRPSMVVALGVAATLVVAVLLVRTTTVPDETVLGTTGGSGTTTASPTPPDHGTTVVPIRAATAVAGDPDPIVTCSDIPGTFRASTLHSPVGAENGDGPLFEAFRAEVAARTPTMATGYRLLWATGDQALFGYGNPANEGEAARQPLVAMALVDGRWQYRDTTSCPVVARVPPPGEGDAFWFVDAPPAADDTSFVISVHAMCVAAGTPDDAIELVPRVVETDTQVALTITSRPGSTTETHDCRARGPFPLRVTLLHPLGSRTLMDGQGWPALPAQPTPSPITPWGPTG